MERYFYHTLDATEITLIPPILGRRLESEVVYIICGSLAYAVEYVTLTEELKARITTSTLEEDNNLYVYIEDVKLSSYILEIILNPLYWSYKFEKLSEVIDYYGIKSKNDSPLDVYNAAKLGNLSTLLLLSEPDALIILNVLNPGLDTNIIAPSYTSSAIHIPDENIFRSWKRVTKDRFNNQVLVEYIGTRKYPEEKMIETLDEWRRRDIKENYENLSLDAPYWFLIDDLPYQVHFSLSAIRWNRFIFNSETLTDYVRENGITSGFVIGKGLVDLFYNRKMTQNLEQVNEEHEACGIIYDKESDQIVLDMETEKCYVSSAFVKSIVMGLQDRKSILNQERKRVLIPSNSNISFGDFDRMSLNYHMNLR